MPKLMSCRPKDYKKNLTRTPWAMLILLIGFSTFANAQTPEFAQIFEQHGVVMLLIEPESGHILDANPAAVTFYGQSRDSLRGIPIQQINTLSAEQVAEERSLAAREGRNYFIFRHRLVDGEIRTVEVHSHPFSFDGRPLLLSMIQDITPGRNLEHGMWHYQQRLEELVELKAAEAAAQDQHLHRWLTAALLTLTALTLALLLAMHKRSRIEKRLHAFSRDVNAFLDQTTDFIYFKDAQSRIRFCSQPLARITGHRNWREMIGKHDSEIFPPDTARIYEEEEQAIFANGHPVLNKVNPYYDADGHVGYVQTHKWPLFDTQGEVIGVFGISRDITEHKLFEQTLSALNGNLARLTGEEFFRAACRLLCETLGTDIAFVGEFDDRQQQIQVIEGWAGEQALSPFRYALADTPCADVMKKSAACYPENVQALFPRDHMLGEMGIEAYVGNSLLDKQGQPLGILVTLGRKPLPDRLRELAPALLELFIDRISSEMQRNAAEAQLMQAASVFKHANEGILITDAKGTIVDVNAAFTSITGYSHEEAVGKNPRILRSGQHDKNFYQEMWQRLLQHGRSSTEIWNRRKNGELYAEQLTISAVYDSDGQVQRYVGLFSDITTQKEQQRQLEHIAHYDPLTGLPNRVLLADRLQQAMVHAQRHQGVIAVIYLDLDGFKAINDSYGHDVGDRLLISLAEHLKATLREGDTLARLGGDEFVAILHDLPDIDAALPLLQRLLNCAASQYSEGEHTLQVSASLGSSFYPQAEPIDADQLLRQADQAMYQAKLAGKNRFHLFDTAQDRLLRDRHEGLEQIRQAIENQEFVLYYQPKVSMRTGKLIGAEALIRWQHPEHGLQAPASFLPLLEGHSLMVQLGDWVIDTALAQLAAWRQSGLEVSVSVNVDALQLAHPDFIQKLGAALARHPSVQAGDLELEVLETSALQDMSHVSSLISDCQALGVSFSLDDFGTGYSSLTYLKRLPVETLKIDQSFVRDMLDDPDDLAILHGVIGLAESFQRTVIAEGVETEEHGELLLQLGCELGQGYAIARPMPAGQLMQWHGQWQPATSWTNAKQVPHALLPVLFSMISHRAWINHLRRFLYNEQSTPPELNETRCHFGRWLSATISDGEFSHPALEAIVTLHHQVHQTAEALVRHKQLDEDKRAQNDFYMMEALRDRLLTEMWRLLDR